jgi:hypothetical protein
MMMAAAFAVVMPVVGAVVIILSPWNVILL